MSERVPVTLEDPRNPIRCDYLLDRTDAVERAGCGDAAVLEHCRGSAAGHVRGCWVIDRLIGRR